MSDLLFAFLLTLFAGMATGIGSLIAFMTSRTNYRMLSVSTGLSAGVMLYVSFVEIFPKAHDTLMQSYADQVAYWMTSISFFGGMLLIGLIDNLIPSTENPHELHEEEAYKELHEKSNDHHDKKLLRMGIFTALAIGIHNFPEGLATFLSALSNPSLGIAIAVAIALHNIPEGISVSVPIYYATNNRRRAFFYSVLSGLAEPIGALVAYGAIVAICGVEGFVVPPLLMGCLFAGVAGIMVYISIDELLPVSRAYGKGHDSLLGLIAGMVIMALSLALMR